MPGHTIVILGAAFENASALTGALLSPTNPEIGNPLCRDFFVRRRYNSRMTADECYQRAKEAKALAGKPATFGRARCITKSRTNGSYW